MFVSPPGESDMIISYTLTAMYSEYTCIGSDNSFSGTSTPDNTSKVKSISFEVNNVVYI